MQHLITGTIRGSIAEEIGIRAGDVLLKINGCDIIDVVDYQYLEAEEFVDLLVSRDGQETEYEIEKDSYEPLGLCFETQIMSPLRSCSNKCMFCFVDQLPENARDSMRFKDDDWRMSFLMGNYVTLTNVGDRELARIIERKVSPLYISVHATEPEVREKLIGNPRAGKIMEQLNALAKAGLYFNTQIVACPGINDGLVLDKSISELAELFPYCKTLSVVPVGLTQFRGGLSEIQPFTIERASYLIDQVESYQRLFIEKLGQAFVYAADELYVLAGRETPPHEIYGEYEQLDNGVGMLALMWHEVQDALKTIKAPVNIRNKRTALVTGVSAGSFIKKCLKAVTNKFGYIPAEVYVIENNYFGSSVTVSGLVTGGDIIAQLRDKGAFAEILLPSNMLRPGTELFLDGTTVSDVENELNTNIRVVGVYGEDFVCAVLGMEGIEYE